jgi:hypothetical protein
MFAFPLIGQDSIKQHDESTDATAMAPPRRARYARRCSVTAQTLQAAASLCANELLDDAEFDGDHQPSHKETFSSSHLSVHPVEQQKEVGDDNGHDNAIKSNNISSRACSVGEPCAFANRWRGLSNFDRMHNEVAPSSLSTLPKRNILCFHDGAESNAALKKQKFESRAENY